MPRGVETVLRRRLEALSDECRTLLETASVAGHELELEPLAATTKTPRPRLLVHTSALEIDGNTEMSR
jgi:hypothetical protein